MNTAATEQFFRTPFTEVNYLFLLPLIPIIGAIINGIFGKKIQDKHGRAPIHYVAVGASALTFVIAVMAFLKVKSTGMPIQNNIWRWFSLQGEAVNLTADMSFRVDQLTAVMLLIITGVGTLIHIFSVGYMSHDKPYWRFFAWLNLFLAMMLVLVLGDSFLLMFVGWEGVGLASFGLIGFYYQETAKAQAGLKAFLVNRVGDFSFIVGMSAFFWAFVSVMKGMPAEWQAAHPDLSLVRFADLMDLMRTDAFREQLLAHTTFGVKTIHIACIFVFFGAAGKSAQIPLYVWLPDAMAGPTPVSALMHAATMVTAGVYMMVRLGFLLSHSDIAMTVVACTGALTALFAASMGLFQTDLKKVLAYSTVSQLGYMFLGVGVGAFSAGIFHLMTHAFFKACLFLGSGSIIFAMHHKQEMKDMGGLKKLMPITYATFFVSTLAIAGCPPFAGFFSKDEILWRAYDTNNLLVPGELLWVIGVLAAAGTTFYMFRLVYQTFSGTPRADAHTIEHVKEYKSMTGPLIVLGFLATVGGLIGLPAWTGMNNQFDTWLTPVTQQANLNTYWKTDSLLASEESEEELLQSLREKIQPTLPATATAVERYNNYRHKWVLEQTQRRLPQVRGKKPSFTMMHSHTGELILMGITLLMALLAWLTARKLYKDNYRSPEEEAALFGPRVHKLIYNKYYVDEIYKKYIINASLTGMRGVAWLDKYLIDGVVNASSFVIKVVAWIIGSLDARIVDGAVNGVASLCTSVSKQVRTLQTGRVQNYVMAAVAGAAALILITFMI